VGYHSHRTLAVSASAYLPCCAGKATWPGHSSRTIMGHDLIHPADAQPIGKAAPYPAPYPAPYTTYCTHSIHPVRARYFCTALSTSSARCGWLLASLFQCLPPTGQARSLHIIMSHSLCRGRMSSWISCCLALARLWAIRAPQAMEPPAVDPSVTEPQAAEPSCTGTSGIDLEVDTADRSTPTASPPLPTRRLPGRPLCCWHPPLLLLLLLLLLVHVLQQEVLGC
jgi:hypothetical protein